MTDDILVTGGSGFLGSHLCEKLLRLNFNVTCLDNLFTGNIKNISHLLNSSKFKFLEHDVTEFKNIECNNSTVVDFPFEPVTAIMGLFVKKLANSISLIIGIPLLSAETSISMPFGMPGLLIIRSDFSILLE